MVNVINKLAVGIALLGSACVHANTVDEVSASYEKKALNELLGGKLKTEIIHNSGNTVSIYKFYNKNPDSKSEKEKEAELIRVKKEIAAGMKKPSNEIKAAVEKGYFPYSSSEIKLSTLYKKNIRRDIPQLEHNIFVIGNDKYSLDWLKQNKDELMRFGASGIMTKATSRKEFIKFSKIARPLSIIPLEADFIKSKFGVTHYPVLITNKGEFH
jgi:integrating conjugative element protein (TIGR03765 family)